MDDYERAPDRPRLTVASRTCGKGRGDSEETIMNAKEGGEGGESEREMKPTAGEQGYQEGMVRVGSSKGGGRGAEGTGGRGRLHDDMH